MNVVIMGVTGSGKSTLARRLAAATGGAYRDADEFHPPANIAKMAGGTPLTETDRGPWLDAQAALLHHAAARARAAEASGRAVPPLFLACPALRRAHRDRLRDAATGDPGVRFVWLRARPELLAARMAARQGHFMPASLLPSQLALLEPPAPPENVLETDAADDCAALVAQVRAALGLG